MNSSKNIQEGGDHYKNFKIQPIDFITKNGLDWFQGSIVKYTCRHQVKGQSLDIKKVIHYASMLLEDTYGITTKIVYSDSAKAPKRKRKYKKQTPSEEITPKI